MEPFTPEAAARRLEDALSAFDRPAAERICAELSAYLHATDEVFPGQTAVRILGLLRRKRQFDLLQQVADALIQSGQELATVYRQYAQALLDQGLTVAGLRVLEALSASIGYDPYEAAEARGLIGRAYKQMFVATETGAPRHRQRWLEHAVRAYHDVYAKAPTRLWHGVNAAALLLRAERDGIELPAFPEPGARGAEVATQILTEIGPRADAVKVWDRATAVEANLALGRTDDALEWLAAYLKDDGPDAFELGSMLRQLTEVWQLTPDRDPGARILPALQAKLLQRQGGEVEVGSADVSPEVERTARRIGIEKVFGPEGFESYRWFEDLMLRCRAVTRIEDDYEEGVGTGFLVHGPDLHPTLPETVLVTNAHVVPDALDPANAILTFRGLGSVSDRRERPRIRRVLWTSPESQLDATIAELDVVPAGAQTCPLAKAMPVRDSDPPPRVYVIGHPEGSLSLKISIRDNHLLDYDDVLVHYRAPTQPGSSGSPVFDKRWNVIALHHAGDDHMPMLGGRQGTYQANEGIRIDRITAALLKDPPQAP
jgi:V8-like Glu-specific endopeptidase/phosphoglycolate phosphatase-like HAD superfamily hydrolase